MNGWLRVAAVDSPAEHVLPCVPGAVDEVDPLRLLAMSDTTLAGELVTIDGEPRVRNSEPAPPAVILEIEELWRAGGEDENMMFGLWPARTSGTCGVRISPPIPPRQARFLL